MEIIGVVIALLVIIVIIVFAVIKSNKTHQSNKKHVSSTTETFMNLDIRPETITQKYNVIADTIQHSSQNTSNIDDGVTNYAYEIKFPTMLNTYVIKQIYISGLLINNTKFRVAVRNSADKSLRYIGFQTSNSNDRLSDTFDENSQKYIKMTTGEANGTGFILDEVTDIYGNDIVGDEILLLCSNELRNNNQPIRVFVTGYPDGEKFDLTYLQKNSHNITTLPERPKISSTDIISKLEDNKPPYVITKITLNAPILLGNINNITGNSETGNNNIQLLEGDRIAVLFKNNYTNNTIYYPGPVESQFIFNSAAPTLYFNNNIVANHIILKVFPKQYGSITREPFFIEDPYISEMRGYVSSIDDINRFKLQYNITDIRGSINPDDVCPSTDKFMMEQLNSEIILDTLEYQDKINQEKRKLVSHKENLLRIDEQSEDIARLNAMITRLENINRYRQHKNDAMNTLNFTRQLEEAMKLRERLDQRLATQQKNKFHTSVTVNHPFDLTPEEDMRI